jgi:hypothetical protein
MQGMPMDGTDPVVIALYAVVLFAMGACIAAAAPACNNPIFAEIVPPELRNMVRPNLSARLIWHPPLDPLCCVARAAQHGALPGLAPT